MQTLTLTFLEIWYLPVILWEEDSLATYLHYMVQSQS